MAIEDEDLGALLDETEGEDEGEATDDDEAFDAALDTAKQIYHARAARHEVEPMEPPAPPVKAKPGGKPPVISLKKA